MADADKAHVHCSLKPFLSEEAMETNDMSRDYVTKNKQKKTKTFVYMKTK